MNGNNSHFIHRTQTLHSPMCQSVVNIPPHDHHLNYLYVCVYELYFSISGLLRPCTNILKDQKNTLKSVQGQLLKSIPTIQFGVCHTNFLCVCDSFVKHVQGFKISVREHNRTRRSSAQFIHVGGVTVRPESGTSLCISSRAGECVRCVQLDDRWCSKVQTHLHEWNSWKQFDLCLVAANSISCGVQ